MNFAINKQTLTLIVGFVIIIILLLHKGCNDKTQLAEQLKLYEAAQDTLEFSRNKLGQQTAEIELMVADNKKDLLRIESKDSTIIQLQSLVKGYKGKLAAATILGNTTNDNGSSATVITRYDTIIVEGNPKVLPTYKSVWDEKWSKGNIIATKDSITRNILVHNDYEITQGWIKNGFLKGKSPVVKIKNLNPNTVTEELRSFTVKEKKKKFNLGVGAMYGVSTGNFTPSIVVGVGIQYSLIRL